MEQVNMINSLKEIGDIALANGESCKAVDVYTTAIHLDPKNHVLFSNRSSAHAKSGNYQEALADANTTVLLNPSWSKGYSRKGNALTLLRKFEEAIPAYQKALKLQPENQQLIDDLQQAKSNAKVFQLNNHKIFAKLVQNPQTNEWLKDPDFVEVAMKLSLNPFNCVNLVKAKDRRLLFTLSVMMGLNLGYLETLMCLVPTPEQYHTLPENIKLALLERDQGNECYKKKDFVNAIQHFKKAIEHDATDISFYTKLAAIYFEEKEYEKCIKECLKAIEIGQKNRDDFRLIAEAFTRIGNAHKQMGLWKLAKYYFEMSMHERYSTEIKTLLSEVEKKIVEEEKRKVFVDPVKAEQEKELGNEFFQKGDYSTAVKHYSQAIIGNPDDPMLYSQRASCYIKISAFDLGLDDFEQCFSVDPFSVKGWIRKGKHLQSEQKTSEALTAYKTALDINPGNPEALEGYQACLMQLYYYREEDQ